MTNLPTSGNATKGKIPFVYTLIYSAIVIIGAQLKISMFTGGFVFSAGIIMFAILMLVLDRFATLPVVFISAVGVMLTRAVAIDGQIIGPDRIWEIGMPDFVFYATYGIIVYILFQYWSKEKGYVMTFFLLMIPDFVADAIELWIRQGSALVASTIFIMILVAAIRSFIVMLVYLALIHYGLPGSKLPQKGINIVDGKVTREVGKTIQEDTPLACAARDANSLYHKLQSADAPAEILDMAKSLAQEIECITEK